MRLSDYELLPGVVLDVKDPHHKGRIKCAVPSEFDDNTQDKDLLPWVYPFCMFGYQGFAMMVPGNKIWLLKNTKAYSEYWYLPYFDPNTSTSEFIKNADGNNPEVLLMRTGGGINSYITYDDKNGIDIATGISHINIAGNGNITIKAGNVDIEGQNVHIGPNKGQATVLGETLYNALLTLGNSIAGVGQQFVAQDPHAVGAGSALQKVGEGLVSDIQNMLSTSVTVSD